MPGEQLACFLHAAEALGGDTSSAKGKGIPLAALKKVFRCISPLGTVTLSTGQLDDQYGKKGEITFDECKAFILKTCEDSNIPLKITYDKIEHECWKICKSKSSSKLSKDTNQILWKISNRLTSEESYPPKIWKYESTWFAQKLATALGNSWIPSEHAFAEEGLSFQEFTTKLYDMFFRTTQKEKIDLVVEEIYFWLVKEIMKTGWLYKRTRQQANWTNWTKRWFVLTPGQLEYFSSPQRKIDTKSLGDIFINDDTKIEKLAQYQGMVHDYKDRFKIWNPPNIVCELAAHDSTAMKSWMDCINEARFNGYTTPLQTWLRNRRIAEEALDQMFRRNVQLPSMTYTGTAMNGHIGGNMEVPNASINANETERNESEDLLELEEQKLKVMFMKIDTDGNGKLSRTEFYTFFKDLGLKMSEKEASLVFDTCDKDKNGEIFFDEFSEYFAKNILSESGTGESVGALRSAFLQADRDGSGTLTFKEFAEYMWDRKRSNRISQLFDAFSKMSPSGKNEMSFDQMQGFLKNEGAQLPATKGNGTSSGKGEFARQLKCVFEDTEVEDLADYVRDRWDSFAAFKRKGATGEVVMTGGQDMVADFVPGEYNLIDLACFSDLPPLVPKHTVVPGVKWESSRVRGKSGKIIFPADFDGKILTDMATNEHLRFYGCSFADSQQEKICLLYRHGIQDFTYENEYLSDYVKATNGGSGIEKHEFSHLDCPLDEENGYFILGKITDDAELHITAFKVPMRHTLYVPGGSIHSNDYLKGTWRTMLSDEADIDHVHLTKRGTGEHFSFSFC